MPIERNTRIRASQIRSIYANDIEATNAAVDNYVPSYDEATGKFTWIPTAGGVFNLPDLGDVNFDSGTPTDNQVLTYDAVSGKWKSEAAQGGASQLSDLSDVGVTTPTNKNVLVADGDSWESRALLEADISDLQTYLKNILEDTTPQLGGDLDLNGFNIDFPSVANISDVKDENDMASDSATMLATQQSIKAYVDNSVPNLSTSVDDFTIKYENSKLKIADRIELNIMLNAFRIAINGSLSQFGMVDGITDKYQDETGVDTVNSLNEDYDSANDLYSPTSVVALELDYMEYATDGAAQAAYVSSDAGSETAFISQATVNDQNLIGTYLGNERLCATSFVLNAEATITKLELHGGQSNYGSPSGDVTIRIETDSSDEPSGTLAHANATYAHSSWTAAVWNTVDYTDFDLPAGTYWIVVSTVHQSPDAGYRWGMQNSGNPYADGWIMRDVGAGWVDYGKSTYDATFKVWGIQANLQCYSESSIKNQGSYSLKAVAVQTDSLNDTLTKSGLSIDLTDIDTLKIWAYASRTGTNIQIQIHDSGGTTSTKDIVISSATTWTEITWDISGISNANKDDIDSIIIKIINDDAENTFYVDNFYAPGLINNMTLISNSFTAEAAPDDARIVLFEEDVDSITLQTDLKAYVSRDGGSTYAQVTLSDEGDYQSGKRILTGVVDLTQSGVGSGTNIEYKIETLNNKELKLHGIGLHWD